jgi:hypothetical protein
MTDKRPTPDASAGKSRPKRAAPTIDLTATDVTAAEGARRVCTGTRTGGRSDGR